MSYKEKVNGELVATSSSNWNYYSHFFKDGSKAVFALAKEGSGASDCIFGSFKYFKRYLKSEYNDVTLTEYGKTLFE